MGFVRKLPHDLVASFRSTLKEVVDADLLLLVLDASSPQVLEHYNTIKNVLEEIAAEDKRSLIVLNKIDLVEDMQVLNQLKQSFPDAVMISALDKLRLDELLKSIQSIMDESFQTVEVDIPFTDGKTISEIQDDMDVLHREYYNEGVRMTIKGPSRKIQKILGQLT